MGLISKKRIFSSEGRIGGAGPFGGADIVRSGDGLEDVASTSPEVSCRLGGDEVREAAVVGSSRWAVEGAPLRRASRDELVSLLPFPAKDANKYTRGKLTLVAGSDRYPGAACLAALAASRMGTGYIETVAPSKVKPLLVACSPSLVVTTRKKWDTFGVASSREGRPQAVCIGPGFDSDEDDTAVLVLDVLDKAACPVLVDGSALSVLATKKGRRLLKRRFERGWATVVTPHGGEAVRLAEPFGFSEGNPSRLATLISLAYGVTVVLKGPDTFVSDGECTYVVTEGTPDLAKAGTGDVLAGMASALLAQGVAPLQAGVLAATLHALAGRAAGQRYTSFGVRAEDVADCVPQAIVELIG